MKYLFLLFGLLFGVNAQAQYYTELQGAAGVRGTIKRTPGSSLSRASGAGFSWLTDAVGNMRIADFPAIESVAIPFEPTATGNVAFLSSFVVAPSGSTYYIDWQGRAILLQSAGGGAADADWYDDGTTTPPTSNSTHAWRAGAATIGQDYNEGNGVELTIADPLTASTSRAVVSLRSTQKGHLHFKKSDTGKFNAIEGNGNLYFYNDASNSTGGGIAAFVETLPANEYTPSSSQAHVVFDYDGEDIYFYDYPNTRLDADSEMKNVLSTNSVGMLESRSKYELLECSQVITQTAHGFTTSASMPVIPVRINGSGDWVLADASVEANLPTAFITKIISANSFELRPPFCGWVYPEDFPSLTGNNYYYLTTSGTWSTTPATIAWRGFFLDQNKVVGLHGIKETSGGGTNIYNSNGSFSDNRIVDGNGKSFELSNTAGINIENQTGNMSLGNNAATTLQIYSGGEIRLNTSSNTIWFNAANLRYTNAGVAPPDGHVLTSTGGNGTAVWQAPSGGGGGSPAGSTGQVQYNKAGGFGADAGFTYTEATQTVFTENLTVGGLKIEEGTAQSVRKITANTTLPAGAADQAVWLLNTGQTTVTITADGANTILGAATATLPRGQSLGIWFDATTNDWRLLSIGNYPTKVSLPSNFSTTNTAATNITGFVTPTLKAGVTYKIEVFGRWSTGSTATGLGFGWEVANGTATVLGSGIITNNASITAGNGISFASGQPTFSSAASGSGALTDNHVFATIEIAVTTDCTLQFKTLSETGTSVIIVAGSYFRISTVI